MSLKMAAHLSRSISTKQPQHSNQTFDDGLSHYNKYSVLELDVFVARKRVRVYEMRDVGRIDGLTTGYTLFPNSRSCGGHVPRKQWFVHKVVLRKQMDLIIDVHGERKLACVIWCQRAAKRQLLKSSMLAIKSFQKKKITTTTRTTKPSKQHIAV